MMMIVDEGVFARVLDYLPFGLGRVVGSREQRYFCTKPKLSSDLRF